MLIALPNVDGTFGCILFLPFEGRDSFAQMAKRADVTGFFSSRAFPTRLPLMPDLAENFFANPTGSMVTVKCLALACRGPRSSAGRRGACHRPVLRTGN